MIENKFLFITLGLQWVSGHRWSGYWQEVGVGKNLRKNLFLHYRRKPDDLVSASCLRSLTCGAKQDADSLGRMFLPGSCISCLSEASPF